jgi:hypothetical protein
MRITAGWISIFYNVVIGLACGVILALWSHYEAEAIMAFTRNGPMLVLTRPLFSVGVFGAAEEWMLLSCAQRKLGIAGLPAYLVAGIGIAVSVGTSVAGCYFLGRCTLNLGHLLVLSAFGAGAVIALGVRRCFIF